MENPFDVIVARLDRLEQMISQLNAAPSVSNDIKYLSRTEAADLFKITTETLLQWTKQGKLKAYRMSRRVYYKQDEIDQAMKAMRVS